MTKGLQHTLLHTHTHTPLHTHTWGDMLKCQGCSDCNYREICFLFHKAQINHLSDADTCTPKTHTDAQVSHPTFRGIQFKKTLSFEHMRLLLHHQLFPRSCFNLLTCGTASACFNQSKHDMRMLIKSLNKSMHSHSQDKSRGSFVNGLEVRGWERNGVCALIVTPCHHRASGNNYGIIFKTFPKPQHWWVPYCNSSRNMGFINNFCG